MRRENGTQVAIYYLEEEELADSLVKNEICCEEELPLVAILCKEVTCNPKELEKKIANEIMQFGIFTTSGDIVEKVSYENIFVMDAEEILGVVFHKRLVEQIGAFHPFLKREGLWEFCCRALEQQREGICLHVEEAFAFPETLSPDERASVYAYVVRHHMNRLHSMGVTDQVFQGVCKKMQEWKCFSEFQNYLNIFLSDTKEYERIASQTAPFLIMRGDDTCYGVLQSFADDLGDALKKKGQSVIMIGDNPEQYDLLQGKVYKGIIGFQTKALEIDFFRKMSGPKFQFWMDYPLHFKGVLRNLPEDYFVLCQDGGHAELIREYYHTAGAMHFPLGGKMNGNGLEENIDRPYDIVFVGSYFANETDGLQEKEKEFYDFMLMHPDITFEEGLRELKGYTKEQALQEEFAEWLYLLKPACRAVIGYFREKIIAEVLRSGAELHVYGEEWNKYPNAPKNLIVHPNVTVEESLEEWKKAKIALNIMSWHKDGMTERIANIMCSGAVCLTEESQYLRTHMLDGDNVVMYRLSDLNPEAVNPELVDFNPSDDISGVNLVNKIKILLRDDNLRRNNSQKAMELGINKYSWTARAAELQQLAEKFWTSGPRVEVFVATHVAFQPPKNPIYIPLHVGRKGKTDLGYLGDDTGENISDLNFLYGELTGLFWIWQNVSDVDYVGLCHYRRYFINSDMQAMKELEYLELLQECDAIVPKHMECENGLTYYEHFGQSHNCHDLDAVEHALVKIYPKYYDAWRVAMEGSIYYWGNLVVTSLPIMQAYAEWLFTIFSEAGEEIDVSGYDNYHKRVFGFLSEQMFYVFALANGLRLQENAVGVSAEKAETVELKEELKKLLSEGKKSEAKELFEKRVKERPDVLLAGSDIHRELSEIISQFA